MARRAGLLAAILATGFWTVAAAMSHGGEKDFHCLWAFARLMLARDAAPYDPVRIGNPAWFPSSPPPHTCEMSYPPPAALVFAPLAAFGLEVGATLFALASVALGLLAAVAASAATRGRLPVWGALLLIELFPGYYYDLALGQNGLLTLAILCVAFRWLGDGAPLRAGLLLAVLAYKPQWLVATAWLPAIAAPGRRRRFYAGLASGLAAIGLCSAALFGVRPWIAWLDVIASKLLPGGERARQLRMAWDLRNATAHLVPGPGGEILGWTVAIGVAGVAAIVLASRASRDLRGPAAAGLLMVALLAAPHVLYYDAVVLLLPVMLLTASFLERRYPPFLRAGLLASLGGLYAGIPISILLERGLEGETRRAAGAPPLGTISCLGLSIVAWCAERSETVSTSPPA
ncbi:MAG: glycosyltransferase family 87 protein [Acidobacteriota bacterium]